MICIVRDDRELVDMILETSGIEYAFEVVSLGNAWGVDVENRWVMPIELSYDIFSYKYFSDGDRNRVVLAASLSSVLGNPAVLHDVGGEIEVNTIGCTDSLDVVRETMRSVQQSGKDALWLAVIRINDILYLIEPARGACRFSPFFADRCTARGLGGILDVFDRDGVLSHGRELDGF